MWERKTEATGRSRTDYMKLLGAVVLVAAIAAPAAALEQKTYRVYIVSDTLIEKFVEVQDGFKATLDKQMALYGAKAEYTVFDTKADKATVPGIIKAIQDGQPDLIAVVNNSRVFADTNITLKLTDPRYRFVSENCIPVQSGVAKEWDRPGGNVTGVGVFTQFTSIFRLAKSLSPSFRKVVFWTWDSPATAALNEYFFQELNNAGKATGISLVEFKKLASTEDQFDYMLEMDRAPKDRFAMGLSVYVHRDGTPANMAVEESDIVQNRMKSLPIITYDETAVKYGALAGACVIWHDLGVQMAEKALKVLEGANPGDMPWSYPRKYNLMFNVATAKNIGFEIPRNLLSAAYRVYTDFKGTFTGAKN